MEYLRRILELLPTDRLPENSLSSFLRVSVCVLTIVIPDDLEHAPTCDSCHFQKSTARCPAISALRAVVF